MTMFFFFIYIFQGTWNSMCVIYLFILIIEHFDGQEMHVLQAVYESRAYPVGHPFVVVMYMSGSSHT